MRTKIQDILDNIAKDYYTMPTEPDKLIVYPWYLLGRVYPVICLYNLDT